MNFTQNPAKIPQLGFTHAGQFHADDVFSAALLKILRPDIRIYRGFDVPKGFSGIVFDIGAGPFDHHSKNSPRRPNGVAYAAFGLLWREYGHFFLQEEEAARFDEKFVQPLDLDDNTGCGNVIAGLISSFNPSWDSDADQDAAFEEAVQTAHILLYKKLESLIALERGKKQTEQYLQKMTKEKLVILPNYMPWKPVLIPSEAEFVVFPSQRGGYSLQCVPKDFNSKTGNKVPMPGAWRGKSDEELVKASGIASARFCHLSGFMFTCESLDDAVLACRLAKDIEEKRLKQSEEAKAKNSNKNKE